MLTHSESPAHRTVRRRARAVVPRLAALALAATVAVTATACGTRDDDSSTTASGAGFPVSIESSLGTTTITAQPQRVITIGWGSTEAALALGVTPVGIRDMSSDSGTDDGMLPWVKDAVKGAEPVLIKESSKSIPYEQIAALNPDLILAVQSGLTADQYAQLTKIAPTVAQPGNAWQTSWQDQTTIVGKALGKSDEAAKLVTQAEKQIADAKAAHPEFAGKTVASTSVTTATSLNFYLDGDPRMQMLSGLGFTLLPALADLRKQTDPSKFAAQVSWENVSKYSPDVLTAWYLDKALQSGTEANPAFANLSAVQHKAYVPVVDPPLVFAVSSPNVLNISWMLERFVPMLSAAAKAAD